MFKFNLPSVLLHAASRDYVRGYDSFHMEKHLKKEWNMQMG